MWVQTLSHWDLTGKGRREALCWLSANTPTCLCIWTICILIYFMLSVSFTIVLQLLYRRAVNPVFHTVMFPIYRNFHFYLAAYSSILSLIIRSVALMSQTFSPPKDLSNIHIKVSVVCSDFIFYLYFQFFFCWFSLVTYNIKILILT